MSAVASREWRFLRLAMAVVAVGVAIDLVAWKVWELTRYRPSRLELTLRCLRNEKGAVAAAPAPDPLAASAGDGSVQTTIEGNVVTVALASTVEQALKIVADYRAVASGLDCRLERRDRVVYLWRNPSAPTQRQVMYECQY